MQITRLNFRTNVRPLTRAGQQFSNSIEQLAKISTVVKSKSDEN